MDEVESLSHTKWDCKYHAVFIPKCRRKTLYAELRRLLGEVFRKLAMQKESRHARGRSRLLFHFGEYSLDIDRRELRRAGGLVAIEPQVFDLLVYLIRNRDRVVSKDDLLDGVWGGRIVSESTLTSRIEPGLKA